MASEQPADEQLRSLLAIAVDPNGPVQTDSIRWPGVVQLALNSGLAPLLFESVERYNIAVPPEPRTRLKNAYYQVAAANTRNFEELERLVAALSRLDIPVMLLKGAALAETLYGNIALRPMGDLDLAIRHRDVESARDGLAGLGYRPVAIEEWPGYQVAYRNQMGFSHPEPYRTHIELHWHLVDVPYYIHNVPELWFWENSVALSIAGHSTKILNPAANLIYLPAHLAFHHRFHGLRWHVDLALLIRRHASSIDWREVSANAQQLELLMPLRETVRRLHQYWPSLSLDEPLEVLNRLEPTPQDQRIFRLLTAEPRTPFLSFYTDIVCLASLRDRVRFVLLNTFPQPTYMIERYGIKAKWTLPYWYAYRLGDGAVRLARTIPQALRLT